MPWIDIHDRQLANPGGPVRTEQATCYTGKCYFASEYINVGDSIENKLRQLGAKPAKSVSGKTQVVAIGHNADMSIFASPSPALRRAAFPATSRDHSPEALFSGAIIPPRSEKSYLFHQDRAY